MNAGCQCLTLLDQLSEVIFGGVYGNWKTHSSQRSGLIANRAVKNALD